MSERSDTCNNCGSSSCQWWHSPPETSYQYAPQCDARSHLNRALAAEEKVTALTHDLAEARRELGQARQKLRAVAWHGHDYDPSRVDCEVCVAVNEEMERLAPAAPAPLVTRLTPGGMAEKLDGLLKEAGAQPYLHKPGCDMKGCGCGPRKDSQTAQGEARPDSRCKFCPCHDETELLGQYNDLHDKLAASEAARAELAAELKTMTCMWNGLRAKLDEVRAERDAAREENKRTKAQLQSCRDAKAGVVERLKEARDSEAKMRSALEGVFELRGFAVIKGQCDNDTTAVKERWDRVRAALAPSSKEQP